MLVKKIQTKIHNVRGQKVILDFDLSIMYQVENRSLKQSVKRNIARFPADFMFQLSKPEWIEVITNCDNLPRTVKYSPALPYAFTEQGVAMLSSVLKSKKALAVNIGIMRAFVFIRQYAMSHEELTRKLKELESKYDKRFKDIHDAISYLLREDELVKKQQKRRKIGFRAA